MHCSPLLLPSHKVCVFPEEKPGSEAEQPLLGKNKADAVDCPFLSFLISKGVVGASLQLPSSAWEQGKRLPARRQPARKKKIDPRDLLDLMSLLINFSDNPIVSTRVSTV